VQKKSGASYRSQNRNALDKEYVPGVPLFSKKQKKPAHLTGGKSYI
jgi:hypothetical protein